MTAPAPLRCPRRAPRRCVAVPPTRSILPRIDSARPRRSAATASGIEPGAAVAHVERDAVPVRVEEHRDLVDACVPRGVRHRLACGEHERLQPFVERRVAGAHDVDAHAVQLLDLGGGSLDGAGERAVRRGLAVGIEPRAQLPLLAPRELPRVAGLLLDERQRLQHGVVHARGELGALLLAHARRALLVALAREPPRPRHERRAEARSRPRRARAASRSVPSVLRPTKSATPVMMSDDRRDACAPRSEPERRPRPSRRRSRPRRARAARRASRRGRRRAASRIAAHTSITVPEMRRLRGGAGQPGAGSKAQAPG